MSASDTPRFKHGHTKIGFRSPTYGSWSSMRERCTNPKKKNGVYIKRGITICQRWMDSFSNFLADMGERPEGATLDRIDNDKGYCPENCRWATMTEQHRNTRRSMRWHIRGKTYMSLRDAVQETGISHTTIMRKVNRKITGYSKSLVYGR